MESTKHRGVTGHTPARNGTALAGEPNRKVVRRKPCGAAPCLQQKSEEQRVRVAPRECTWMHQLHVGLIKILLKKKHLFESI